MANKNRDVRFVLVAIPLIQQGGKPQAQTGWLPAVVVTQPFSLAIHFRHGPSPGNRPAEGAKIIIRLI
jgi:hypothetical protein